MLHNDYQKELKFGKLPTLGRAFVRAMGHDYLSMLISEIEFVGRAVRNGLAVPLDPPPPQPPDPQSET